MRMDNFSPRMVEFEFQIARGAVQWVGHNGGRTYEEKIILIRLNSCVPILSLYDWIGGWVTELARDATSVHYDND